MLEKLNSYMREAIGRPTVEEYVQEEDINIAKISVADVNLSAVLAWNEQSNYVTGQLDCAPEHLPAVVRICSSVGDRMECGSVLFAKTLDVGVLEGLGFAKQFIRPLNKGKAVRIDFAKISEETERLRKRLTAILGLDVEFSYALDERPFILSLDWAGKYRGRKFALYLHLHALSGAAYLEELSVPKPLRNRGLGTQIVRALVECVTALRCRYLYLSAKKMAERFWKRQPGFDYIMRANLREERRRKRALRRRPGWDKAWVQGQRLQQPNWVYRNHPQDDLDLFRAIRDWPVSETAPVTLTG